ncbi:MAG: hypothetical protein J6P37_07330 [Lachnospiraceae bacterium]|nr:hypothetical protein [Lachnospiraceae bacterium]
MKTSEILFNNVKPLWDEASDKEFVLQMAKGSLDSECFKKYMIQDYLYLFDYNDILKDIKELSDSADITSFIDAIINEVEEEIKRVHVPNMENLGIKVDGITKSDQNEVFKEYISYMKSCVKENGLHAGIITLLQCSWCYAYIADKITEKYAETLNSSAYKEWFEAYTCQSYTDANQIWIDTVDRECADIDKSELDKMAEIFTECAKYENKIWDAMIK